MSLGNNEKQELYEKMRDKANAVLLHNLYVATLNGKTYKRTVPSKEFYVHQWNWDSATVAMGLIHVDPERAYDEIRALISGQWSNGLIAQITYNPGETKYYPQAEKWHTEAFSKGEIITSGITQPPVLAIAVDYIRQYSHEQQKTESFLNEVLPAVIKYHDYLKKFRDPEDEGLLTVVHPWESGTDNSPRWDSSYLHLNLADIPQSVKDEVITNRSDDKLGKAPHRPTDQDYYRFMGLIDFFAKLNWDYEEIVKNSPFAVKDILFTSVWARANEALADTLSSVGRDKDAGKYIKWSAQTKKALANTWSQEHQQYLDIDVAQGRHEPIVEATNAMFMPLWAGAPTKEQLPWLLQRLSDPAQFWPSYPVPTTALNSLKFELSRYWRGPTWPVTNFFIIEGLRRYSQGNVKARYLSDVLIDSTLNMIVENGFYEYFDPTNGEARPGREDKVTKFGFATFSWPAAIFISLYDRYRRIE